METELSSIINGSETMSVKELYQLRKDILETINTEIKRKKTINRDKKKKIVRPSLWVTSGLPHLKIIVAQTSQGAAYVLSN